MDLFIGFAKTCFTPEDMKARALKVADGAEEITGLYMGEPVEMSEIDAAQSEAVKETTKKGTKRKRSSKKRDAADEEVGEEAGPTKGKKSAKKSAKKSGKERAAQEQEQEQFPSREIVEDDRSPANHPGGPLRPTMLPNIDPRLQQDLGESPPQPKGPKAILPHDPDDGPLLGGPNDQTPRDMEPEVDAIEGEIMMKDREAGMNMPPFPLKPADLTLLDHSIWHDWFVDLVAYLESYDLGPHWGDVLGCLMVLEGRAGFDELKGAKFGLPSAGHPAEVGVWIKNYRRKHPKISLPKFADEWWIWWKGMQPDWHNVMDVDGALGEAYRGGIGGDWECLWKSGQNGFVSLLACLAWWGQVVRDDAVLRGR
ncbi:uncharacterized protein ARMOST_20464 [Armillaria ostoyae]|uniref:Uncharacterized protein n=1 Tax=Armillaria ostoyae TaxID=47428 RepID=A0A284S7E6_ARMOS|nr:uncharacterized protein ARMOST_20464 [Armillaria ostoyae]